MARSDWAALLTDPAQEYTAHIELQRLGVTAYLPQFRKRHHTRPGAYVMRQYPLFPRYLFVPAGDARSPSIRLARGVCRFRPVLAGEDGRLWRAPGKVIAAVQEAEARGLYDEILNKGDTVALSHGVLSAIRSVLTSDSTAGMVDLLLPLFGGVRAKVPAGKVIHA